MIKTVQYCMQNRMQNRMRHRMLHCIGTTPLRLMYWEVRDVSLFLAFGCRPSKEVCLLLNDSRLVQSFGRLQGRAWSAKLSQPQQLLSLQQVVPVPQALFGILRFLSELAAVLGCCLSWSYPPSLASLQDSSCCCAHVCWRWVPNPKFQMYYPRCTSRQRSSISWWQSRLLEVAASTKVTGSWSLKNEYILYPQSIYE